MDQPLTVLVLTTIVTAAFHTLIPDHWLPFVLVARSRGWSGRQTAVLTALSACLHVAVSISLGLAAFVLGRGAQTAAGIGESLGRISAGFLVLFGVSYAAWFYLRGGHQHSFGMHPHHAAEAAHETISPHPHDLMNGASSRAVGGPAPEDRGAPPSRTQRRRAGLSGMSLAAIVGFNPCVLVIPYIYLAGTMGTRALVLVATCFAASTVACMVGVAMLGLKGTAKLESPFLMRYGEAVSGALIALTGLVIMFSGG